MHYFFHFAELHEKSKWPNIYHEDSSEGNHVSRAAIFLNKLYLFESDLHVFYMIDFMPSIFDFSAIYTYNQIKEDP